MPRGMEEPIDGKDREGDTMEAGMETVSVLAVLVLVEHMVEVTRYYTITAAT